MKHLEDSYVKEFEASVDDVGDGKHILLNQTYFYPASGGQPSDEGVLTRKSDDREFKVLSVRKSEAGILHEVSEAGLAPGDEVLCSIDWARRHKLMRSHTAAHVVSEVIHRGTGALITGNQLELDKVRIDFSLEPFDPAAFSKYIEEANGIIAHCIPVETRIVPRSEVEHLPFLSKLANGLPQHITDVRIVEIPGFDVQGCGGTHVKNTAEIGRLAFLRAENKGKQNRRVYFEVLDA
jgi:misacylated tRNA(Ala) deacylase